MTAGQQAQTYGGAKVSLPVSITASSSHGGVPRAGIRVDATGDLQRVIDSTATDIGDWISPKSGMNNYEVMLQTISGGLDNGTANTWQQLNASRFYEVVQSVSVGTRSFTGTLKIRFIGTTTDLATSSVSLTATVP